MQFYVYLSFMYVLQLSSIAVYSCSLCYACNCCSLTLYGGETAQISLHYLLLSHVIPPSRGYLPGVCLFVCLSATLLIGST